MTRSRLQGRVLALGWGIAVVGGLAGPDAQARQDRQEHQDRPDADAAKARDAAAHGKADASATVPPAVATTVPATGPASGKAETAASPTSAPAPAAAPAAAPSAAPSATPDPTEGDRTALINQDVAQHPPQTAIPSRDPSHLQTTKMKLGGLLDRSVHSLENNEVGRVIDVMTGDDGKPAALELDVGGFMGVGNRRIAVAWSLFDLSRTGQNDPLRVALSAAQVRSAPAMDEVSGEMPVVTGAAPIGPEPASPQTPATATVPATAPAAAAPGTAPGAEPDAKPQAGHGGAGADTHGSTPATGPAAAEPSTPAISAHPEPAEKTPATSAGTPSRPALPHHDDHATPSGSGNGDPRF